MLSQVNRDAWRFVAGHRGDVHGAHSQTNEGETRWPAMDHRAIDHRLGGRVRVYKVKVFARFQRKERISDAALCEAIGRAQRGLIDADLGGGLIKQRVGRPGQGRSGGFRTVLAFQLGQRAVFMFGFAKNERANLEPGEQAELVKACKRWLKLDEDGIKAAIAEEKLWEVHCD